MSILAEYITQSKQPIVPANLFTSGQQATGLLDMLLSLLTLEQSRKLSMEGGTGTASPSPA
jgi:hypothetical protein